MEQIECLIGESQLGFRKHVDTREEISTFASVRMQVKENQTYVLGIRRFRKHLQ